MPTLPLARLHVDRSQARIVVENIPDRPGTAAEIFCALADAGIGVDLILENFARDGRTTLTFTLPEAQRHKAFGLVTHSLESLGGEIIMHGPMAKISVSELGPTHSHTVAPRVFRAMAKASINIHMISTTESEVAIVISTEDARRAEAIIRDTFADDLAGP